MNDSSLRVVSGGPSRLPPGQSLTRKFPVVGERSPGPEALDRARWRLTLDGLVENPIDLSLPEVEDLLVEERTVDLHCVTGWTRLDSRLGGCPLARLLERARPRPEARFVRFEAYSPRAHDSSLPLELAAVDSWLVSRIDGEPLTVEHGGPLRVVTPSRYFYKSVKWLRRIELLAEDRLGFWEVDSAYHNVGDPWPGDQRFTTGSIDPEELARLRAGRELGPFRASKRVILGADLRDWAPVDRNLAGLRLKGCDLRGAHLTACDLRGANLSLSDLRGAELAGARFEAADLEGVDFTGADLTGADFSGCALSATRFGDPATQAGARVERLRLDGATGLLESQERYLALHGVVLPNAPGDAPIPAPQLR